MESTSILSIYSLLFIGQNTECVFRDKKESWCNGNAYGQA